MIVGREEMPRFEKVDWKGVRTVVVFVVVVVLDMLLLLFWFAGF